MAWDYKGSILGPQGDAGPRGAEGDAGLDGKSAYEVAVDNGFEGDETEWLASLKGEPGEPGTGGGGSALNPVIVTTNYAAEVGDYVICVGDGTNTIVIDTPMTAQHGDRIEVTADQTYPPSSVAVSVFGLLEQTYGFSAATSPSPGRTVIFTYLDGIEVPGMTVEPISGWYATNYANVGA